MAGTWVGAVWCIQVCIAAAAEAPGAVRGHRVPCDPKELLLHREMVLPEHTLHCSMDPVCWMQGEGVQLRQYCGHDMLGHIFLLTLPFPLCTYNGQTAQPRKCVK